MVCWMLTVLIQFLLFSRGSSRNPWNYCDEARNINGIDLVRMFTVTSFDHVSSIDIFVKSVPSLDRNVFFVNCTNRGITKVPQNLPTNVEALLLNANVIRRIERSDFLSYPNISALGLDSNCVPRVLGKLSLPPCNEDLYIEPGALQHLVHLKWLSFAGNYFHEFPQKLPLSIKGLDITWNLLGDVTEQLRKFSNLTVLIGSINCFRQVSINTCPRNFTITQPLSSSLQYMDLSDNNWTFIPKNLLGNQLKALSIATNRISRLRRNDFVNATNLGHLDLSGMLTVSPCSFVVEDGVFDPLNHLKFLNLSLNGISFLPDGIFKNNENLDILDLSLNCLQKTIFDPTYLVSLYKLRFIDLSYNNYFLPENKPIKLLRLGEAYSSLSSLEEIIFGSGLKDYLRLEFSVQFLEIDNQSFASLSNLTHLTTIDISYCNVHRISFDAWSGLRHLNNIRASNNHLTFADDTLSEETVAYLHGNVLKNHFSYPDGCLKYPNETRYDISGLLDYSYNKIVSISEKTELLLATTKILDLSFNQIREIRSDDLKHLVYLCSINLSQNPIVKIDHSAFSTLSNLRQIIFFAREDLIVATLNLNFLCHLNQSAQTQLSLNVPGMPTFLSTLFLNWNVINNLCKINSLVELNVAQNDFGDTAYANRGFLQFMPKLRNLVLSNCRVISPTPDNWLQGLDNLEVFDLSHNKLAMFPSTSLRNTKTLEVLNLNYNNILELKGNLSFLIHLENLTLAHNKIGLIEPGFFSYVKLLILDLSSNFIFRLDPSIFNKDILDSLVYLDVRWNELDCSCNIWDKFHRWYISDASGKPKLPGFFPQCTSVIDQYYGGCVTCKSPINLHDQPVSRYGFNTSCDLQSHLTFTIVFTLFFALFILCGAAGYSKVFKRFVFRKVHEYFRVQSLKPGDIPARLYENKNAFVFFDHNNDELGDWVDNKLVPGMMNGNPSIELFLAGRDIDAGASSTNNLLRLVTNSRKTVVIFSGRFCDTPICKFLLMALQEIQYSAGRDQLILVEWHGAEAVCVPELIQETFNRKFCNFLRCDQTNDDEVMFFETLRTAFASSTRLNDHITESEM
ncbi:toll-like receptor 7 [Clavelina lepadiformis]|uniref:toll-like receptor 7 n=1 Tax=Clavelina lepadiformis TaxID=159417 RepID=UPI00404230C9